MKKFLVCVAFVGLMAATAVAEPFDQPRERSTFDIISTVSAEKIDAGSPRAYVPVLLYEQYDFNAPSGFYEALGSAAGGNVSADDYNLVGSALGATYLLRDFYFVGGVNQSGGVLFFTFYDNSFNFVEDFGVSLPYVGAYSWHITITTPMPLPDGGFVNMWANDGYFTAYPITQGLWWMNDGVPTVGTTGPTYPGAQSTGGAYMDHLMAIVLPEPGTLALFGMGVLTLVARRRK